MPRGVILAAGAGSRFGGPKALAHTPDGEPFIAACARVLMAAGCAPPLIVVIGAASAGARDLLPPEIQAEFVENPAPERGMYSSIQLGLSAARLFDGSGAGDIPPGPESAVLLPVDHPFVQPETVEELIWRLRNGPAGAVTPCFRGQDGHPAVLGEQLIRHVLLQRDDRRLDEILLMPEWRVERVEVRDPGVLRNINTRDDLI
ncbi:MAG: Molybdenum cofactor guanylyltransferase [Myxococcota bacterium]|nr:Molybdenum cofactor guanylyltransferase [Myxococcota bacterium]